MMPGKREPLASRPDLPAGYGILGPTQGKGLLPWSWAVERLARARNYFLVTARPDGRPHAAVIWGVWVEDRFYFATFSSSRKAQNLARNPYCVLCPEHAGEAVIVEGVVERRTDAEALARFAAAYEAKYDEPGAVSAVYVIKPSVAFAFISERTDYPSTATRWRFEGPRGTP